MKKINIEIIKMCVNMWKKKKKKNEGCWYTYN